VHAEVPIRRGRCSMAPSGSVRAFRRVLERSVSRQVPGCVMVGVRSAGMLVATLPRRR
jgi:hypothetical protein